VKRQERNAQKPVAALYLRSPALPIRYDKNNDWPLWNWACVRTCAVKEMFSDNFFIFGVLKITVSVWLPAGSGHSGSWVCLQVLLALLQLGKVKYVISQNVDGLHLRSGIPRAQLAELHGNTFSERCPKCKKEYIRDFEIETVSSLISRFRLNFDRCCQTPFSGLSLLSGHLRKRGSYRLWPRMHLSGCPQQ
jgi:hypothetical protein